MILKCQECKTIPKLKIIGLNIERYKTIQMACKCEDKAITIDEYGELCISKKWVKK